MQIQGLVWDTQPQKQVEALKVDCIEIKVSMMVLKSCFEKCGETFNDYTLSEVKDLLKEVRDNLNEEYGHYLHIGNTEAFFISDDYLLDCLIDRQKSFTLPPSKVEQ